MKKFIALIEWKQGVTAADTAAHSAKEVQRFRELFDEGVITEYFKKIDSPKFWLILRSPSMEEARMKMESFPYYGLGFITIDIEELTLEDVFNLHT